MAFSSKSKLSANYFNSEESKLCHLGKSLLFTRQHKFRLFKIESLGRWQIKCSSDDFLSVFIGWKTLWEKEKMLVTTIFSFSHNVFESLFKAVKTWKRVSKSEITFTALQLNLLFLHCFKKASLLESSKLWTVVKGYRTGKIGTELTRLTYLLHPHHLCI